MNSSRRRLLIQLVAGATVAITGRMFWLESEEFVPKIFIDDEQSWIVLSPDDRLILAMITPVILQGVMVSPISGERLVNYLKDFDLALSFLPQSQQQEFKQLLSLLKSMLGRLILAKIGSSWNNVAAEKVDKMLESWRNSSIELINVTYVSLKQLSFASWYGNPQNWLDIGYPGPPGMNI